MQNNHDGLSRPSIDFGVLLSTLIFVGLAFAVYHFPGFFMGLIASLGAIVAAALAIIAFSFTEKMPAAGFICMLIFSGVAAGLVRFLLH